MVVLQVGDGLVEVGEVECAVALAGAGAGLAGDGGEGGGDGFRASVQDAQELPVDPLARGDGVAGVQAGGCLADILELSTVSARESYVFAGRSVVATDVALTRR
jgi:hypothetical protein